MLATVNDFPDIIKNWRMAFSDSDEYIEDFLKMMYKDGNAIVSREDGVAVSQAFLLPAQFVIHGRPHSAYYFYAAATHPSHRNKGHMAKIMAEVKHLAELRKIDFIVLVPAEDWLFDYYAKFGYKTSFYKRVAHFTREDLAKLSEPPDLTNAFSLDLFETRQEAFALYDFLNWGAESLKYAMYEHNSCSGSVAFTSDSYAMYNMGKDTAYVKEFCTADSPGGLINMLLLEDEAMNFTFNLPVNCPLHSYSEEVVRVGMHLPISENAKLIEKKIDNAYIGLTLG